MKIPFFMKTILCFGDSNTWGWDPVASAQSSAPVRHPHAVRWPGVLRNHLGAGFHIIEEGQSGRTTVHDDPLEGSRNGRVYLEPCLESHQPLDLVVMMLGTNDLKTRFGLPAGDVALGVEALVKIIQRSKSGPQEQPPQVLLIAPPAVGDLSHLPALSDKFARATEKSLQLPELYRQVAQSHGCAFLDGQLHTRPSALDGLHLEAAEHVRLGQAVAEMISKLNGLNK
jgi:lysophospholipase L1-like esterase